MAAGPAGRGEPHRRAARAGRSPRLARRRRATRALSRRRSAASRRIARPASAGARRVRALCAPEVIGALAACTAGSPRRRTQLARSRPVGSRRGQRSQRLDHRADRPGRLVPGRAAAREGLHRHRPGPFTATPRAARLQRAPARRSSAGGRSAGAGTLRAADRAGAPARDLSPWQRRRSCPPRGSARRDAERDRGLGAAILEAVRDLDRARACSCRPPARSSGQRARAPSTRTPAADRHPYAITARRAPAGGRDASQRRPAREFGDRLQPRVRAPTRAFVTRRITRAAAAIASAWRGADDRLVGAVRDWSFAGDTCAAPG